MYASSFMTQNIRQPYILGKRYFLGITLKVYSVIDSTIYGAGRLIAPVELSISPSLIGQIRAILIAFMRTAY